MIFIYLVLKGRSGNIFQKRVEEEARGLSVCSDPRLRQAIVNRSQENASAFAFGGDFSIRRFFSSKSHVSNYPDGQLVGPREDVGEGRAGEGEGDFLLNQ